MPDDHSPQANEAKQLVFRWQLSDLLTLLPAFAFVVVDAVNPSQRWAKFAMCVVVGWWIYRCLKAGRQPSLYQIAVLSVAVGVYVVAVGVIMRLMERGFS